jgi:amino acid transporter
MWNLTLLAAGTNVVWFLLPLAAVISLVYNASRYELPERILRRSLRLFITIIVFMSIVLAVLMFLSFKM